MVNSSVALLRNFVQPMPATAKEMQDVMARDHVLIDEVDDIHVKLYDMDPKYRLLLAAIDRDSSVSGATTTDDVLAALKIKAYAEEHKGSYLLVEAAREHTLMLLTRRIAKKYNIGRKQRKEEAYKRLLSYTSTPTT